ncbi:MAG: sigma-70 family RNA polymerase sigma factor [Chloroflexota bacterium]|nr:sigma-70 family RNA polymerase sigma factor [Chloroflexota bacterium]
MAHQLAAREYAVIDEDALIERLHHGDQVAFERLFLRHYPQVYRVLYHLVGSREEAEDLAQETFLALYHQPPAAGTGAALVAWLCRVALNRGYNALRGERRAQQRLVQLAEPPAQIDPQDELARAEDRALVRAAIAKLPERQGRLLLLRYAGLSYGEIAGADLAPASVGTLLARAERAFEAVYMQFHQADSNAAGTE